FAFTALEAVDNPPIDRVTEIEIARHLFVDGSATEPRAKRITLEYGSSLIAIPDTRPGKIAPWHQQITTPVILRAELVDGTWDVEGNVTFYLVRGDSALIPKDLQERGFGPNQGHWYIERWEDNTSSGEG